jgi:single-stranded DNA-binding protein
VIDGLISGTLVDQAESRQGKNGTRFVVAKVKAVAGDGESLMVNVIAFNSSACTSLMALGAGDAVALAGALAPKVWTDKQGNTRPALDMVANQVMTAYHASHKRQEILEGDGAS